MATSPLWRLGKDLTLVTLTGQSVDPTTGVWSAGTAYSFTVKTDSLGEEDDPELEDLRPVNSVQKNMVGTGSGSALDLVIILETNVKDQLAQARKTYDYFTLAYNAGADSYLGYFRAGKRGGGIHARGKNTASLRLEPTDPGVPQAVYA